MNPTPASPAPLSRLMAADESRRAAGTDPRCPSCDAPSRVDTLPGLPALEQQCAETNQQTINCAMPPKPLARPRAQSEPKPPKL
jgi:hypothetical protein